MTESTNKISSQQSDVRNSNYGTHQQNQLLATQEAPILDIWAIFRCLKNWWWLISLIILSAVALSLFQLSRTVPVYKTSVKLEVQPNEQRILRTNDPQRLRVDPLFLGTQTELLKSETLAVDVIETLNLLNLSLIHI